MGCVESEHSMNINAYNDLENDVLKNRVDFDNYFYEKRINNNWWLEERLSLGD